MHTGHHPQRAAGPRKWDVDGNEIIDFVMGHGSLLFGHAHPLLVEAVSAQIGQGTHYGDTARLAYDMGRHDESEELYRKAVAWWDQLRQSDADSSDYARRSANARSSLAGILRQRGEVEVLLRSASTRQQAFYQATVYMSS